MNKKTMSVMTSSKNEHYNTPKEILDPIRSRFGQITLDPCSNPTSIVQAKIEWDGVNKDGLKESWQIPGVVFENPPYGRAIKKWVIKAAEEAVQAKKPGSPQPEIFLLGPARTDTKWFQEIVVPTADEVLFWKGRLVFGGATDPAVFPSFLAYWGHRPQQFKLAFLGKGFFL